MKKAHDLLDKLTKAMAFLAFPIITIVVLVVLVNIVLRALFNAPIKGTVEIVQYGVMTAIAFCVGRTTFIGAHTRVTMLTEKIRSYRASHALSALIELLSTGLFGLLFYELLSSCIAAGQKGRMTEIFHMPFTVVYGILLIGIAVIILVLLYLFVEALLGAIKGEEGNA